MTEQGTFIEDCYRQYSAFLVRLCRREVGSNRLYADLVDTCIQDTFLLAYQAYPEIKQHANLRAWLARTCLNRLLPYAKLQRKRMEHEAFSLDEDTAGSMNTLGFPDTGDEKLALSELLDQVLGTLSDKERLIFHDYFVEGLTAPEIARQRNLHIGTVKATIHSIRKKAKKTKKVFFD